MVVLHSLWNYPEADLDDLAPTAAALRKIANSKIVVIGPPVAWIAPGLPQLILKYFANANSLGPARTRAYLREDVRNLDKVLRTKAAAWGVAYISLWDTMCNADGCLMRVGPHGRDITAFDNSHLTLAGSAFLVDAILPRLIEAAPSRDIR